MRFGKSRGNMLAKGYTGTIERVSGPWLRRPWVRIGLACCVVASLAIAIGTRVIPAKARPQAAAVATTYGPSDAAVAAAVNAAGWPQASDNWCGVATIAAIAQYRTHPTSQQDIASYLNSDAAVSEWGTPSVVNGAPPFKGDIARDSGTDPRSLVASLAYAGQGTYHELVDLRSNSDATLHLILDLLHSNEPISVIVYHGLHSVLVSGVVATGNPLTNPSSVTGFEVWDPGVGSPFGGIQPDREDFVPISTWLNSAYYWGFAAYSPNYFGSTPYDPDPSVGPYTFDPSSGENGHLWIGHYVYIRPDASTDAFTSVSPDWAINQSGAVIEGFHGETPSGYTGPVTSIPIVTQLSETSFDAPAFWSEASYQPISSDFAPTTVLSWVGTDSAHHLNVSVSTDGVNYTNKITLGETSFTRPSVIVVPNATMTANVVVIAWAGTDTRHSLNVIYDVYGTPQKVTFPETSTFAPSLAYFNGQIWMSWIGTDQGHTLNTRGLGPQGLTLGAKEVLWGNSSSQTPDLVADPQNNQMLLTWQMSGSGRLNLLQSPDGIAWSSVLGGPSVQTSNFTPALLAINPAPSDFPAYYWAWTGTDSGSSLNLQRATVPNAWSSVSTYGLPSLGAPLLGYIGEPHQIVEAWTGTDYAHHINLAIIPV